MTEDRLRKVLELERAKRFGDRAVTAGLDVFLKNITTHEGSQLSSSVFARIQALPVAGYQSLTPAKRKLWIEETLAVLKEQANGQPEPQTRSTDPAPGPAEQVPGHLHTSAASSPSGAPGAKPPGRAPATVGGRTAVATARKPAASQPRLAQGQARFSPGELEGLGVDAPIYALKRVPFSLGVKFDNLHVQTVRDLLLFFPRRHVDYGDPVPVAQLEFGREQTVRAQVWSAKERQMGPRMRSTEATIGDASGMMQCVWFNQPWIAKQLPVNAEIVVSGRVSERQGRPCFDNPEWEIWSQDLLHTGRLVPIYPLTAGLQNRTVRRVMQEAIDRFGDKLPDPLPEEMRDRLDLAPITDAVTQMHYPTDRAALEHARRRLAFEELLPIQLTMQLRRRLFQKSAPAEPMPLSAGIERAFKAALPFTLTGAQERVLFDVLNDLRKPIPMSRLVQGDVGSGKTVIAAAALVAAIDERPPGRDDGADGDPRRAALPHAEGAVQRERWRRAGRQRTPGVSRSGTVAGAVRAARPRGRSPDRAAHRQPESEGTSRAVRGARARRHRHRLRNARADPGRRALPRSRCGSRR